MMRFSIGLLLLFASIPTAYAATGPSCDCQQIVGSCMASMSVRPTQATKGSYGAELKITSSAPYCSKVSYYVDGTPYFNVLSNTNTDTDSLWGQKPITRTNVTELTCQVCKRLDEPSPPNMPTGSNAGASSSAPAENKHDLTGTWNSVQTCSYGTGSSTMTINYDGSSGSISGNLSNGQIDSGQIHGSNIEISATAGLFRNNHVQMQGKVVGANRISGTYTQTAVPGVCSWEATKQ